MQTLLVKRSFKLEARHFLISAFSCFVFNRFELCCELFISAQRCGHGSSFISCRCFLTAPSGGHFLSGHFNELRSLENKTEHPQEALLCFESPAGWRRSTFENSLICRESPCQVQVDVYRDVTRIISWEVILHSLYTKIISGRAPLPQEESQNRRAFLSLPAGLPPLWRQRKEDIFSSDTDIQNPPTTESKR
jgi:hypothetical protein